MRNASIGFDQMTASALTIETDQGVGYAFDSIGRYGKSGLLRERFIPRLLAARSDDLCDHRGVIDPLRARQVMMANEKDGGHGERAGAVGLLDAALWDLRAKIEGVPLWRALADRYGMRLASAEIPTYGSCGHFTDGADAAELVAQVRRAVDLGYTTIKIKLGGSDLDTDVRRVEAAQAVLPAGGRLAVDVNGQLIAGLAPRWFAAMAARAVAWVEEPTSALDYAALALLAEQSPLPIATGENIFSFDDARNLLRYGGLRRDRDLLQFDMLLAYGVDELVRIVRLFSGLGWTRAHFYPHAGHLFAAHCVAGLKLGSAEAAPDPSLSYGAYWDGVPVRDGMITIPDLPGVGYEAKANLIALMP